MDRSKVPHNFILSQWLSSYIVGITNECCMLTLTFTTEMGWKKHSTQLTVS